MAAGETPDQHDLFVFNQDNGTLAVQIEKGYIGRVVLKASSFRLSPSNNWGKLCLEMFVPEIKNWLIVEGSTNSNIRRC